MDFHDISDRWFLSEPLFFAALCYHKTAENRDMACPFRSGHFVLEYNPNLLDKMTNLECELLLRHEMIRILLKHPYQRQPLNAVPEVLTLASDVTIYEHSRCSINPLQHTELKLPAKLSFEEYYNLLYHHIEPIISFAGNSTEDCSQGDASEEGASDNSDDAKSFGGTDGNYSASGTSDNSEEPGCRGLGDLLDKSKADASALWEEDELLCERMNQLIENAMLSRMWGSIPRGMQELLKLSIEKSLNVRRQLGLFKASILSTQRRLTRMRPSRRYGWNQMGVVHPYTTRLLVAIDTSGSVSSNDIRRFFGIINSFFTYGIPQIDVIQFDADIHLPLLPVRKAAKAVKIAGRGGTCFQPPVDYFEEHKEYDGMIVFTDGYAPLPEITTRRRILWVLINHECYNDFQLSPKIYL